MDLNTSSCRNHDNFWCHLSGLHCSSPLWEAGSLWSFFKSICKTAWDTDDSLKLRYNCYFLSCHTWCSSNKTAIEWDLHDLFSKDLQPSLFTFVLSCSCWQLLPLVPHFAEIKVRCEGWWLPTAGTVAPHALSSRSCIAPGRFLMYVFNSTHESALWSAAGFHSCLCSWMTCLPC